MPTGSPSKPYNIMPAPKNHKWNCKPHELQRTKRIMLQFTPAEKARLDAWAGTDRLSDRMRAVILEIIPPE